MSNLSGVYATFSKRWCPNHSVWLYSDPHFDDKDFTERPSAEEQIKNINSKSGCKDTIIFLGDIGNLEYIRKIRARKKILIMGNHDTGKTKFLREKKIFQYDYHDYSKNQIITELKLNYPNHNIAVYEEYCVNHAPYVYYTAVVDNLLFDEVYEGPVVIGEKLILSHEPIPNLSWAMNIHGHVHGNSSYSDLYHYNICDKFYPTNLNQWLKEGHLSIIDSLHRQTIDKASE